MNSENRGSQPRVLSLRRDAPKAYQVPADWQERPEEFVYIGRKHAALHLPGSLLQNPFAIGRDGDRDTVIALYAARLEEMLAQSLMVRETLLHLPDKRLVCWCAPQRCHGDVLLERAERLRKERAEVEQAPPMFAAPPGPLTNPQVLRDLRKEYEAYMHTQCQVAQEKAKKIKDARTFVLWSKRVMRPVLAVTFTDWLHRREHK